MIYRHVTCVLFIDYYIIYITLIHSLIDLAHDTWYRKDSYKNQYFVTYQPDFRNTLFGFLQIAFVQRNHMPKSGQANTRTYLQRVDMGLLRSEACVPRTCKSNCEP